MVAPAEAESDFAERVAALCPGFTADGQPRAGRKSELLSGTLDGRLVLAKRVKKASPVWAWYLDHEIAMYRAFATHAPAVRTPAFVASGSGILVIERIAGEPLAIKRRPNAALPVPIIDALLNAHESLASYKPASTPFASNGIRPSTATRDDEIRAVVLKSPVRSQLRERLLEDPTDPTWIRDGVRLCGRRGLIVEDLAHEIDHALAAHSPLAFSHGDLLLRNVVGAGDELCFVDWECGGIHIRDWDLALLWTQLAADSRGTVEDAVRDSGVRWRAFLGLCAFALARELRFIDAFPNNAAARAPVEADLASVATRFRA